MKYKLSVVIPEINEERNIGPCLESLENQTVKPEILVVDGGSTDRTLSIVKKHMKKHKNIKLVKETGEVRSPANARNLGFEKSTGNVLIFLDADITVSKDMVKKALEGFKENPDADRIALRANVNVPEFRNLIQKAFFFRDFRKEGTQTWWNAFLTKDYFRRIGKYDPYLGYGEDKERAKRDAKAKIKIVKVDKKISITKPTDIMKMSDIAKRYSWYGRTIPYYLKKTKDPKVGLAYILSILSIPFIFLFIIPIMRGHVISVYSFRKSRDVRILFITPFLELSTWIFLCFGFYQSLFGSKKKRGR